MKAASVEPADLLADIQIIDCDAHFTEPPDLWTLRAPSSMKDRVPIMKTVDGVSSWYLENELFSSIGGNTLRSGGEKQGGTNCVQPWTTIDPASWDPKARIKQLDDLGIYAQILYPNAMGFAGHMMAGIGDVEQRNLILSLYNDFLLDVQRDSESRLFPQVLLPVWDMDFTVKEMVRLRDAGATGFTISDKPRLLGLPDLDTDYFAPMWATGDEMGAVFNFHVASGRGPGMKDAEEKAIQEARRTGTLARVMDPEIAFESLGDNRRVLVWGCLAMMSNARIIVNLCLSDMFDRYPNIKVVSAESGMGWIPFVLETMEYNLDEWGASDTVKRRPTDYFRDHIYVTFWYEKIGPARLIEEVGVNNVLIETDIPHPTCFYPEPRERFAAATAGWDDHIRRRVFQDNAVELYKIPLPEHAA
jgi:predicted TIM-barrel fold metal-dependent hydrolase